MNAQCYVMMCALLNIVHVQKQLMCMCRTSHLFFTKTSHMNLASESESKQRQKYQERFMPLTLTLLFLIFCRNQSHVFQVTKIKVKMFPRFVLRIILT